MGIISSMPHEFAIAGVYMPPILAAAALGFISALVTARLLNRYGLSNYFVYPHVVLFALVTIYTVLFSTVLSRW